MLQKKKKYLKMKNINELCALVLVLKKKQQLNNRRRRGRRYNVKPLNRNHHTHGFYTTYFRRMLENDDDDLYQYTRTNREFFNKVLSAIKPLIIIEGKIFIGIEPSMRLAICLQ